MREEQEEYAPDGRVNVNPLGAGDEPLVAEVFRHNREIPMREQDTKRKKRYF